MAHRVLSQQVRDSLASASDLIAVGLASQEGERTQEEARAFERAKTVSHWMSKFSKPEMALWTLTLGQYDKACKGQENSDFELRAPRYFCRRSLQGGRRELAGSFGRRYQRSR